LKIEDIASPNVVMRVSGLNQKAHKQGKDSNKYPMNKDSQPKARM